MAERHAPVVFFGKKTTGLQFAAPGARQISLIHGVMNAMHRLNRHMLYSVFQAVFGGLRKPSDYERARQSYGPEPYLTTADICIAERIDALVSGNVAWLLRSVLGTQPVAALTLTEYPSAFRRALPVTQDDVVRHMIHAGIPKSVARYGKPEASGCWIHQDNQEGWVVSWIDERNTRFDRKFNSKREAEMHVIEYFLQVHEGFLVDGQAVSSKVG